MARSQVHDGTAVFPVVSHPRRDESGHTLEKVRPSVTPYGMLRAGGYRIEIAESFPELCATNRIPCALKLRCPPAGCVHTCVCDARSTA